MKRRNKILLIILVFLALGVFVLYKYRIRIISYIVPTITSDTINITIKNDTAYVYTKLFAQNKSIIPLQIDSIKYKIGLLDRVYLHEEKYLGVSLKPYDKDTFEFSLKIPVGQILADVKELRKKAKNANYSINVSLQYSSILGRFELPINKWAAFKIPTPPEINVEEVKYTKLRIKYMLALVKVRVTNFNNISLTIKKINYKLDVPRQGVAIGKYEKTITIMPQSEMFVYLPIRIKWEKLSKTLFDVIEDEDVYKYTHLSRHSCSTQRRPKAYDH